MSSTTRTGRIYRIIHRQSDIVYIGSTFNRLSDRWCQHRGNFNRWLADKTRGKCTIYPYFEKHGLEEFDILLVKEYEVCDRKHLYVFETLWINKLNCVNQRPSFIPMNKKDRDHARYLCNKEERISQVKAYASSNKEKIKAKSAAYRASNHTKLTAQKAETFNCECGGSWTKGHGKPRHERSAKHQRWLENQ